MTPLPPCRFIVLIVLAFIAGAAAAFAARRLQRRHPLAQAAVETRRAIERRPGVRGLLDARRDPSTAAGLLLSVALPVLVAGGVALGALALVVRSRTSVDGLDASINRWAHDHATSLSTDGLDAVTQLGATSTVVVLALVLAAVETARTRARWIVPFLVAVVAGELLLSSSDQVPDGPCAPDAQPGRRDARTLVPQRAHHRCGGVLRGRGLPSCPTDAAGAP